MMKLLVLIVTVLLSLNVLAQGQNAGLSDFGLTPEIPFDGIEAIYDGNPVEITLKIGQETRIIVDFEAALAIGPDIEFKASGKSLPSGLFITATEPFSSSNSLIRSMDQTRVIPIVFKAVATDEVVENKVRITDLTVPVTKKYQPQQAVKTIAAPPQTPHDRVGELLPNKTKRKGTVKQLIQLAAQSTHGPKRLRPDISAYLVDVNQSEVHLIPGGKIKATPSHSFQYGGYVVTVVDLYNKSNQSAYKFDPTQFIGYWRYAGIHESNVIPPRHKRSVYLISDVPFDVALRGVVNWKKPNTVDQRNGGGNHDD